MSASVAIIGAGAAGIACARALREAGVTVTLFDKGRAPGGRVCTRREGGWQFDHGAQYLSTERSGLPLEALAAAGVLAPWPGLQLHVNAAGERVETRATTRLVGVPGMSAVMRYLATGLTVHHLRLTSITRAGRGWQLHADGQRVDGMYDWVAVTAPPPQATALLRDLPAALQPLNDVRYASCWTTALGFDRAPALDYSAVTTEGAIAWAAREQSKPGRGGEALWLLQASAAFSAERADASSYQAAAELNRELAALLEAPLAPSFSWARFWRYAFVETPLEQDYLVDSEHRVAYAGDACRGSRVEHAFASGTALGRAIAARLRG